MGADRQQAEDVLVAGHELECLGAPLEKAHFATGPATRRWIHYAGSRDTASDQTGSYEVTNRAQLFGADLGLEAPIGGMELVAGLTLGAVRFEQGTTAADTPDAPPLRAGDTEFVVAPHLMLGIRTGPVMFMPQVSYYFAGPPDLRWPVGHRGIVASLMVVILIETDRFRY